MLDVAAEPNQMPFDDYTDEQLRDYEERLYDREVAGDDVWFERDQVLWEMNRRGMMD